VVTLHQAGVTEAVAPLGTALTPEQVDALRRLTEEVVLCYDGDKAGRNATRASLEILIAADVPTRVVALPDGDDPDSLVRRVGGEELGRLIKAAPGGIEYLCFQVFGKHDGTADGRSRALEEAARLLRKVGNPARRELLVGTLATALDVDAEVVRRAGGRAEAAARSAAMAGRGPRDPGRGDGPGPDRGAARPSNDAHPFAPTGDAGPRGERPVDGAAGGSGPVPRPAARPPQHEIELVMLLADHPELMATADADRAFSLLTDVRLRAICSAARLGQTFLELAPALLSADVAQAVLSGRYADQPQPAAQLAAMADNLQQHARTVELQALQKQMIEAQRRGDRDEARRLAETIFHTRKQPGKQVD
jgi:DNA primase